MLSIALLLVHTSALRRVTEFQNLSTEHSNCKSQVVISRTAHPMPGMIQRMYQFSSDLKNNSQMKFVALVDDTHREKGLLDLSLPQNEMHRYTRDDVVNAFPVWKKMSNFGKNKVAPNGRAPDNLFFHMESTFSCDGFP